jgi:hypothetical protein
MLFEDASVREAVNKAMNGEKPLTYSGVQSLIRSVFDHGLVTVQEREDLRMAAAAFTMDDRASRALTNFLDHVDRRSKAADEIAARTGNKQYGMPMSIPDPGPFSKKDTDLGKFSHGNFDVRYDPTEGELIVTLKVKWEFDDEITAAERTALKQRFAQAIQAWDKAKVTFETTGFVLNPVIRLRFRHQEVNSGEHYLIDVDNDEMRPYVAGDINIDKNISTNVLVHELGHAFGNYDEYKGSGVLAWIERRMWWHDNDHLEDEDAVMNGHGTEFRLRYFDHFERYLNENFARIGVTYKAKLS